MTKTRMVAKDKSPTIADLPMACPNEDAAVAFLERQRWGEAPGSPCCGDTDVAQVVGKDGQRDPHYLRRCHSCRQQFTVRIGTIFEVSKIPLRHCRYAF